MGLSAGYAVQGLSGARLFTQPGILFVRMSVLIIMALSDIIANNFQTIIDDLGNQTFTWSGEEYECAPSNTTSELNLESGGFSEVQTLTLTALRSAFSDDLFPQSKDTLTFNDTTYRVLSQRKDASGALVKLVCYEPNKGI
jgi:hypothetical protein